MSVDAAEIDHVEQENDGDEAENDAERDHGMPLWTGLAGSIARFAGRGYAPVMPATSDRPPALSTALTPVLRAWWRLNRGMTLGARGIATDADGRVLLIRHGYQRGWHLPGGGVEHGETAYDALVREMAEEGGVAPDAATLLGFYSNHAIFPNDHVAVYRVTAWTPCAPRGGREIAARGFFARDALPAGVTPGTRRRLAEAFDGAPVAAVW